MWFFAKEIETKIRAGADFAGLVNRYSQNVESTSRGGFIPPVDWKVSVSSNLNYTVFHLAVNEVRVVESSESTHIVKVAQVNTRDVPPYESVKEEIRKALNGRYAEFSVRNFERTKENLVGEKTVQWNPEAIGELMRWSKIPEFHSIQYSD